MESEFMRLERLYREMGNEHLEDLAGELDELTDEARRALTAELRARGLAAGGRVPVQAEPTVLEEREEGFGAGIPGVFPSGAAMMEQALEQRVETRDGRSTLISFYDGHELSRACGALEEAGVPLEVEQIAGDPLASVPARFDVWVAATDVDRAQALLRERMGLFPLAEVASGDAGEDLEPGVVGQFDSKGEADEVRDVLIEGGFGATVGAEEDGWVVSVAGRDLERAVKLVAGKMGLE